MNSKAKSIIVAGAILAFLGVLLGAFGAHALKPRIDADLLAIYQTGVQYHLVHAIGVILVGMLAHVLPSSKWLPLAGWTMVGGVIVFSGSLYVLSLTGIRALGAVTPLGGVALLVAWLLLVLGVAKSK
ncbi:MAG: DUF423 domain-containing protein [Betaproteobacteria bacterium]